MEWQVIDEKIKRWMFEAREMILASFDTKLDINTKSNRNDLVTNMDKKIEKFYIDHIHESFPDAKIMGERDGQGRRDGTLCDERDNKKGTWIISREDR